MRFLVAPQEFKGSLTARQAAEAIGAGVRDVLPDSDVDLVPMSDGGPGLVDAMQSASGGRRITSPAHDPVMRPIDASWLLLPDGAAVIEMAAASGLVLLSSEERDPLLTTTYGTGELIRAALDHGCRSIVVGVGGSATVDAGAGALQALGAHLLDAHGRKLSRGGGALTQLDRIDLGPLDRRVELTQMRVASDVTSPFCGKNGAAQLFGPQKGASPEDVRVLDAALARFAEIARRDTGIDLLTIEGAGAAGGLAAGLRLLPRATIVPGFALVAEAISLEQRIAASDFVITGEGRLDAQTAFGKTAAGVARLARAHGRAVAIIAGSIDPGYDEKSQLFDVTERTTPPGMPLEGAMRDAAPLLRAAASRVARRMIGARSV